MKLRSEEVFVPEPESEVGTELEPDPQPQVMMAASARQATPTGRRVISKHRPTSRPLLCPSITIQCTSQCPPFQNLTIACTSRRDELDAVRLILLIVVSNAQVNRCGVSAEKPPLKRWQAPVNTVWVKQSGWKTWKLLRHLSAGRAAGRPARRRDWRRQR